MSTAPESQPKGCPVAFIANPQEGDKNVIVLGQATDLILRIVNRTDESVIYPAASQAVGATVIGIDFSSLGTSVTVDPAGVSATGFAATSSAPGVIELALAGDRYLWLRGQRIYVALKGVVVNGEPGSGLIGLTMSSAMNGGSWQSGVAIAKLASPSGEIAAIQLPDDLALTRAGQSGSASGALSVRIAPAAGNQLVAGISSEPAVFATASGPPAVLVGLKIENSDQLKALTTSAGAENVKVSAPGWTSTRIAGSSTPWWELTPAAETGMVSMPQIEIENLVTPLPPGNGHVLVSTINLPNATDQCQVLQVEIVNSTPKIDSFTWSSPQSPLYNLSEPATVYLSWETTGAAYVLLSGEGLVPPAATDYEVSLERTTTFVLTTFDASLNPGPSQSLTIAVTPDPSLQRVPPGAMAVWSGATGQVPQGWLLCDGSQYSSAKYPLLAAALGAADVNPGAGTFKVPDLWDSFFTLQAFGPSLRYIIKA